MSNHEKLNAWVQEMAAMCQPDKIVWIDGSDAQREKLAAEAVASGELIKLNQKKHPGCYYHRTAKNDVARTEHLTYICTSKQEDAGPTNNWMTPEDGYRRAG
ncbi:MAG: phosphoenolpyruvate carboxykinase, partial [Planctomycetes bacterium]|nr:phosphoenolpyruvate carboxykinase [Planctomycetota bacterium]